MSVLFEYFAAPGDEAAGEVVDRVGGPASQAVLRPGEPAERKRRFFGLKRTAPADPDPVVTTDQSLPVYDTFSVSGIDPVVQLGTLEELLTGRPYDEVVEDPRSGKEVAIRAGGERLVVTITDSLTSALVDADDARLETVAEPWSRTEEFGGGAEAGELGVALKELAELAKRAQAQGNRLYCWLSV